MSLLYKKLLAAVFVVLFSAGVCHAAWDISWIGMGITGTNPLGITFKHWFNDKEGNIRTVNLSGAVQGNKRQLFFDYAWEYGRNFTGFYSGISALAEDNGFGLGPMVGIETWKLLGLSQVNLSLDTSAFLVRSSGKYSVAFYARLALRLWGPVRSGERD